MKSKWAIRISGEFTRNNSKGRLTQGRKKGEKWRIEGKEYEKIRQKINEKEGLYEEKATKALQEEKEKTKEKMGKILYQGTEAKKYDNQK